MSTPKITTQGGAPAAPQLFRCPNGCEPPEWHCHYKVPVSQGVELLVGEDGKPEEGEYDGMEQSYDPDPTEYYQCLACDAYVNLDGELFDPAGPTVEKGDRR